MASVASRPTFLPKAGASATGLAGALVVVVGLVVVSIVLRTLALGDSFWMDEGLSVAIANQPFFDIPGVLRQDGSPPLYYMMLSVWMDVFGTTAAATQALSVAIAVGAIPVAFWAGRSLFDMKAGLIAASLAALNPFLTQYAQETRMYSLMVLLTLAVSALFLHAFVYRRDAYKWAFAVVLALLLYTHNWGIFVTAGCVTTFAAVLFATSSDERRPLLRDGAIGFGLAFLLYAPWLPTLLFQARNTGAPWVDSPRLGAPVQISKNLLGGGSATIALILGVFAGAVVVFAASRSERVRHWRQWRPENPDQTAMIALAALGVFTLAIAWLFSQFSPAWTTRYLGVVLGPIFLLAAVGLARARAVGIFALVIVLAIWAIPRTTELKNKSNARDLAAQAAPLLDDGDLVISTQPEQAPLMDFRLDKDLQYATPLGGEPDRTGVVMDWRGATEKLEGATPEKDLAPQLARLPAGAHVLLVRPVTTNVDDWDAPWTQLVRRRSAQWARALDRDPSFVQTAVVPDFYRRASRVGVSGIVYTKFRQ